VRRLALVLGSSLALTAGVSTWASADSTTTTSTTSSTTPPVTTKPAHHATPVYRDPLTDLPDPRRTTRLRSALTIKIDNTPEAHPQSGIAQADVVYEEIVEGGITRLAAIFNSSLPAKVGPVRSVRKTDRQIVSPIGGIFACSGGAAYALNSIANAPVRFVDESNAGSAMFRDPTRPPPHNLYANAVKLMALRGTPRPPTALFDYAAPHSTAQGRPVSSFTVNFASGYAVTYQWDGATRSWARSIFGRPDVTVGGRRLSPKNVVVMGVNYIGGAGVEGSYAQMVGSGPAEVFSAGRLQRGEWHRSGEYRRAVYVNGAGRVIRIQPGQTWVELLVNYEHVSVSFR
jgi:Protein of unknown function (DUF3048) N-terminal domain/Protein of unknown function (DUF3048) C-terminal domain